jgi:hypothetical protein
MWGNKCFTGELFCLFFFFNSKGIHLPVTLFEELDLLVEVYQRFRGPCCLHHQGDR